MVLSLFEASMYFLFISFLHVDDFFQNIFLTSCQLKIYSVLVCSSFHCQFVVCTFLIGNQAMKQVNALCKHWSSAGIVFALGFCHDYPIQRTIENWMNMNYFCDLSSEVQPIHSDGMVEFVHPLRHQRIKTLFVQLSDFFCTVVLLHGYELTSRLPWNVCQRNLIGVKGTTATPQFHSA
jgi:hypothetical protein